MPREINPEISMPRRRKMKHKIHRKKNHVSCNESSDNLQVQYMLYIINFADFYIASAWSPKSDCFQARKLLHCLSSELLRRWCTYEWFYSAVDYPWFSNNEFVHYLDHAKLSHLSKLTRSEWSAIRRYKPSKPWRTQSLFHCQFCQHCVCLCYIH